MRAEPHFTPEQKIIEVELSFEIASEAPDFADVWPSDITVHFNDEKLLSWTSPGDYGAKRGKLTPEWWPSNQYGLLKTVQLTRDGVMLDGEKVSDIALNRLIGAAREYWSLRFEIPRDAKNMGGLTLFGKKFGNHAQDIMVRTFWEAS
jgi:predicted transcriptional regulator